MTFRLVSSGYLIVILIVAIVFLALCSPSNSNFALFFAFSLFSTSLVSIWLTRRNILGLSVSPATDINHPTTTEESLQFGLRVKNNSGLYRPSLTLRVGKQARQRFELPPMSDKLLRIELKHHGRGYYLLEQLSITTDYPIGLFRICLPLPLTMQSWVLPTAPAITDSNISVPIPAVDNDEEMDALHTYNHGDPLNHIHWKSYARTQQLVVKHFAADASASRPHIWLDWEANNSPTEERIVHLVSQANWAQRNHFQFGLRLPNIEIPLGFGAAHYQRCLLQLAMFQCPQENIIPGLTRGKGNSL